MSNSCKPTLTLSNTARIVGMAKTTLTYSVTVE